MENGEDNERQAQIEARAYILWMESGQPEGRADDFWYLAKAQIESDERPAVVEQADATGEDTIPPSSPER